MLRQRKDWWFQLTWCALHATAAALHLGSALYHAQRVREEEEE